MTNRIYRKKGKKKKKKEKNMVDDDDSFSSSHPLAMRKQITKKVKWNNL